MTWRVTAAVGRFAEAASWFRSKLPVLHSAEAIEGYNRNRVFTVAGVTQLDVVQHALESNLRSLEAGTPFEVWQKEVETELTEAWGERKSHRMLTIHRNATSQAYNAGRWRQMTDPVVRALRGYLIFDGVDDANQTPICRALDGTIRPTEDWEAGGPLAGKNPQLHHACRSQLLTLRESDALRRGVTPVLPDVEAAEGFGMAPGAAEWSPDGDKYDRDLFDEYEAKQIDLEKQTERVSLEGD